MSRVWRVPYEERARAAAEWARRWAIPPASKDRHRVALLLVDVQNTFCTPGFELFVGGRSGTAAVDDSRRLTEFIYRNLGAITKVFPTMDTHQAAQIFHAAFLVGPDGQHPPPMTSVTSSDVAEGRWRVEPSLADSLGLDPDRANEHLRHYVEVLDRDDHYALTTWPYHAMLGGIGHALVASVEEALFFHGIARANGPDFRLKGDQPLTEAYSVFGPEVLHDAHGNPIGRRQSEFLDRLSTYDRIVVAGQAKSHCVAWSVHDLLSAATRRGPDITGRVYLLEDCTSPVVVPGVVDHTDQADSAFAGAEAAGAHLVRSDVPMRDWPAPG